MAATYQYYYTVEAFLNWNDVLSDAQILDVSALEGYNNGFPDFIQVHREQESTTAKKWTIEKGSQLQYRIRFYLKVSGDTTTPANNGLYWLRDNIVDNVQVVSTFSAKLKIGKVNTDHHTFKPTTSYFGNAALKNTNGDTFWFTIEAKQDSFQMNTPFTITADIVNDNTVGGDVSNATKHATLKGINPTIVVSKAVQTPKTPQILQDALTGTGVYANDKRFNHTIGLPAGATYPIGVTVGSFTKAYDSCKKQWIGLNISPNYVFTSKPGKMFYRFTKITCGVNGTDIKFTGPQEETKVPGKVDGPKLLAARKEVVAALVANCTAATSGNQQSPEAPKPDVLTTPPTANLRWNPPTHKLSRSLPFGVKMDSLLSASGLVNSAGDEIEKAKVQYFDNMLRKAERGRIFQDALGASILNTNPDKLDSVSSIKGKKQWGFRFMYNPTSFSYSSSSKNDVDWTLGASDPTILLSGNANVSVELYINRIADMSYLRQLLSGENLPLSNMTDVYGRNLVDEEISGLLHRGTEYDIEFLYRVLNGDPLKNPLLFDPLYDGVTSDFGYTTAVPCWMYLNENLRYYGSVASFQVNHVMFDLHMVPMLSVVSISFARYPALWATNKGSATKSTFGTDNVSQSGFTKSIIAGTGNTA
jgi:hypothetical protein